MIGTITHILAKAGYKAMNGPLADERRRLAGAVPPAAYVSYDPRMLAGAGWYGYRIALKGGDRSMLERARYMLEQQYVIRDSYEYYADDIYTLGVLLRQRAPHYGIGGGSAPVPEPDALNFYMPDGGTITLTRNGNPTVVELEYSVDGGATWQVWEEVGNVRSLTLAAGQKMYVRNTSETASRFSVSQTSYYNFSFNSVTEAYGKLSSLTCKDSSVPVSGIYTFAFLFNGASYLRKAPELVVCNSDGAYYSAFAYSGIESIEIPSIIAYNNARLICNNCMYLNKVTITGTQVGIDALRNAFNECRVLNFMTVEFTSFAANSLSYWLSNVSPSGDFYCPAELTIPTGVNGIPSGWTRHDI